MQQSFLSSYPVQVIHNGVDTAVFSPQPDEAIRVKLGIGSKKVVLGVASIWDKRKGLDDFVKLSQLLDSTWQVILIGVNSKQIKSLPAHVMGIPRTESVKELADFYSLADVFVNPTWQDNFPTTNIESLACGTPVITYNTGGSPEAIVNDTGFVVEKGDIAGLYQKIIEVSKKGKVHYQWLCRKRAEKYFNKDDRYMDYLKLYERLTSNV